MNMKVNGVTLREALKRWEMRREAAVRRFNSSFFAKPSDIAAKRSTNPDEVMREFQRCEQAIADLQEVQARYNLSTTVAFQHGGKSVTMSLTKAVKLIGGAGRAENMWRAQTATADDPFENQKMAYGDKNVEWQVRQLPLNDVVDRAANAATFAGALRGAIAIGNTREMDADVNPALFE
jgi:hypothetical protein